MKILLLEDDYLYKMSIKDFLEANRYSVDAYEEGDKALDAIYTSTYDLLLLDIRVPKIDGYEILKEIRSNGIKTPIIMLTSLTDIENLSLGYELGCSDYLRKPFELKELKYRVEHLIRTCTYKSLENQVKIDDRHSFDTSKGILYSFEKPVDLSAKEQMLVAYLVQNKGYFVSIETLHDVIWENKEISYADIRMCIKRVRNKCGNDFIENKKLVGYRVG